MITSHCYRFRYTGNKYHKHNLNSRLRPKFNFTPFLNTRSSRKPIFFTFPRRQIYTPLYVLPNRKVAFPSVGCCGLRHRVATTESLLRKLLRNSRSEVIHKESASVCPVYVHRRREFNFHRAPALATIVHPVFHYGSSFSINKSLFACAV